MAIQDLRAITPGASALIKAICDELGVAPLIDERVRWDEQPCKLSPGTRIVAMIVNALVHRTPLYQVEEFYAGQDVRLLFGPGVSAQDFNDDALAEVKGEWGPLAYVVGRAAVGAAAGVITYGFGTGWKVRDSEWWGGAVASAVGGAAAGLSAGATSVGLAGTRLSWGSRLGWDTYNAAKGAVAGWAAGNIASHYRSKR